MSLKPSAPLQILVCAAALGVCVAIAWAAYAAGPGGYTGHMRAVLFALLALAVLQTAALWWLVLVSTSQHRELRRVALHAATRASRRMSDIVQGQVTAAAASLGAAAADLHQVMCQQTRTAALMESIAAQSGIEIIHPVPPPGSPGDQE